MNDFLVIRSSVMRKGFWDRQGATPPRIVFWTLKQLFVIHFLQATCNVCPLAIPKSLAHREDPITGKSFISFIEGKNRAFISMPV